MTPPRETLVFDTEVYRNYFLLGFLNIATGNVRQFEMWVEDDVENNTRSASEPLNVDSIRSILQRYRVVSFNGIRYDVPIITAALRGATCDDLKELSDKIIKNNLQPWHLGIEPVRCDHVDLFEVAPGMASLKIYGGRLHCPKLQDLPIHEAELITPDQRPTLRQYNVNDLHTTKALFDHLLPQIELREQMSKVYDIDLRSKSDAQIAEAVIAKQVGIARGETIKRPEVAPGTRFRYVAPPFLNFSTPLLKDLLATIQRVEFLVPDGGNVLLPTELAKSTIAIGKGVYRMGIGGLHSSEQSVSHFTDDEHVLIDRDVTSYYPMIILNNNLAPEHMGPAFTRVYKDLVDQRVKAKRAGNKVGADTIKIVVNGSFGKLGSKWSKLYSPNLMIQVTLTGQLSLLMLIERLEMTGITVVSANTDGVAIKCPRSRRRGMETIVDEWESVTGFETEETEYRSLHSRDVNNYVAIKPDGSGKLKGAYAPAGLQKNPTSEVCITAVIDFLRTLKPIEQTIRECRDVRRFVTIRQVNGGAIDQQGGYLGKAVRWYYAKGVEGPIRYKVNNYTVARSEGARALMELPDELPGDIDYEWYRRESEAILADIGVDPVVYQIRDLV